jgi:hypothetical protein
MTTCFASPAAPSSSTKDQIQAVVRHAASKNPRHGQRAIGPSEIGEPCQRRLAYRLLDIPGTNPNGDPWPSIVGTATHTWLAHAFELENTRLGRRRYMVEQRVWLTDGISGTCDLFDLDGAEVIDHKIVGTSTMQKLKRGEIPERYRTQVHLYGYGFERAGLACKTVSLACYPRGGFLDGLWMWSERYNPTLAEAAMDRMSILTAAAYTLNLDEPHNPLWAVIPHEPGPGCAWCPLWRPGGATDTEGCPGGA